MMKTRWMVLLMVAAIGVVGCNKSSEEKAKDSEATKEVADAPKKVEATDVNDVAKPMLDNLTKTVKGNEAVADAVEAGMSKDSAPKVETPKIEAPKVEMPKIETPKVETPKIEAPKVETPKIETPKVEAPKVEAPKVEMPKIKLPG